MVGSTGAKGAIKFSISPLVASRDASAGSIPRLGPERAARWIPRINRGMTIQRVKFRRSVAGAAVTFLRVIPAFIAGTQRAAEQADGWIPAPRTGMTLPVIPAFIAGIQPSADAEQADGLIPVTSTGMTLPVIPAFIAGIQRSADAEQADGWIPAPSTGMTNLGRSPSRMAHVCLPGTVVHPSTLPLLLHLSVNWN